MRLFIALAKSPNRIDSIRQSQQGVAKPVECTRRKQACEVSFNLLDQLEDRCQEPTSACREPHDGQAHLGGNPPVDGAGHESFARAFYAAFPDMHHTIEEVFATEERVAVRFILNGAHTGSFFGIPPTGKPVSIVANVIMCVANGRVTKRCGVFDEAGLLPQIGVLPP